MAEVKTYTEVLEDEIGELRSLLDEMQDAVADIEMNMLRRFDVGAAESTDLYTWISCKIKRLDVASDRARVAEARVRELETMSEWTRASEQKPPAGRYVIAAYKTRCGEWRRVRAMWADRFTLEADLDCFYDDCDYNEQDDRHYVPPGWYECNEHEDVNWRIDEEVLIWTTLPMLPDWADDAAP